MAGVGFLVWTNTSAAPAPVAVWTQHNDNFRTGANLAETELTTTTVNPSQFGKLFTQPVDGDTYAQPLVIPNVAIAGKGTHNVVFVATMNNSVYAFDADNNRGSNAQPLWYVTFNSPPNVIPVPAGDVEQRNNIRNPSPVGIMGTPVIDQSTGTIYLVARTKEINGATTRYVQRLHALDIRSGAEKFGGPAEIQASVPGSGYDATGGQIVFNPLRENQRSALALGNGLIYIMWASVEDRDPYHGWIMAYDASTLNQIRAWSVTPNGSEAGIWQAGQGAAIDEFGSVYATSGNGTFTANSGGRDYGEAVVKLSPLLDTVTDWFAPDNWAFLNGEDLDFGSSGPLLIPDTNLAISGGKAGTFFLMDRSDLGHLLPGNSQIVQSFQATSGGHIHGSPVYWNGPGGPLIYVMGEQDYLKAFHFNGLRFDTTPLTKTTFTAPPGMPGGFMSISAQDSTPGSGIVWVSMPANSDAEVAVVPGILRAFDASDLTRQLWTSQQTPLRDPIGNYAKYVAPTVANGHVYMATFSNQLVVYGLLDSLTPPTGALAVSATQSSATADLTAVGTSDWARWPGYAKKATGGSQISNVTISASPGTNSTYTNDPRTLTWSDGTSPVSGTTQSGIYVNLVGATFTLSAPADTTPRTLTVYAGGFNSTAYLTAHLTDGSAPDVLSPQFSGTGQYDVVQTITYRAASAGQRIIVTWTQHNGSGNITLQAAALGGGATTPPSAPTNVAATDGTSSSSVNVTWDPANGATSYTVYRSTTAGVQGSSIGTPTSPSFLDITATPGLVYYYGVTATNGAGSSALSAQDSGYAQLQAPATPTNVAASDGTSTASVTVTWTAVTGASNYTVYRSTASGVQGGAIGSPTASPFIDPTVTPGTIYYYSLTATNGAGTSPLSAQNSGFASVVTGSGSLNGAVLATVSPANLTTTGSSDWIRWPGTDHKATGGSQISQYTLLAGSLLTYPDDPRTVAWSDGTPTASGSTTAGIYVVGNGTGFKFTAPADPTVRTLTVYAGGYNSTAQLTATLSDGSAPAYVSPIVGTNGQYDGTYQLTYSAASVNQKLTVQWKQLTTTGQFGNVTLQAAAVSAGGVTAPGVPTNVAASDGTSTTNVTVTWTAVSGATSYAVYRSTSSGTQGSAIGTPSAPPFQDTTATPGTTYYYGVTASNAGGTSLLSAQDSGFAAVAPPGVPTNVAASDGTSPTSVSVTWTAVSGATSYTIYRSPTAGAQGSLVGTSTVASFADGTVTPGVVYYYGVTATNAGGTSALSAQNSGFASVASGSGSLAGAALAPTTPVNLTTIGSADWIRWPGTDHKATGGGQISQYTLLAGSLLTYPDDPRTVAWSDGTPTASGSTTAGIYVVGNGTGFKFTAPADPTVRTLTVYAGGYNSTAQLTATLSDGSAPAYVSPIVGTNGQYDGTYQLTYSAASVNQKLTVQWKQLTTTGQFGNVTLQAAAVSAGGVTAPGVPTNVAASDGTSTTNVTVTWTAVSGATSYAVYRSTSSGTQGSAIGTPSAPPFQDTTATPGTTYYYGVTASNAGGTSLLSAQDSGFAAVAPPGVPTNVAASDGTSPTSVSVTWTAVSGATSYTIYRSPTAGAQGSLVGTSTVASFADGTVTPGVVYYYGVTATNAGGTSALSAQNSGFASLSPPAVPTNVAASDGTSPTSVSVTWTAVSGATSYTVYRSTNAGTQGISIGTPTSAAFTDTTPTPDTTYYYGVTATNPAGTSALSAQNSGFASAATGSGSLAGAVLAPTTPVNLTTVGTSDWVRWPGTDHKASGGSQIPAYTTFGGVTLLTYTNDPRTMTWTDGTPTASGSSTAGVFVVGNNTGFRISLPADPTVRTLTLYVGGYYSTAQLTATLSDGSAPAFVSPVIGTTGQYDGVYQITYSAASAGKTLIVQWKQLTTSGQYGNVTLQAAALN